MHMFQISKKSDLRIRLQELVSSGVPELSTSIIDESNIDIKLLEDSGKLLLAAICILLVVLGGIKNASFETFLQSCMLLQYLVIFI